MSDDLRRHIISHKILGVSPQANFLECSGIICSGIELEFQTADLNFIDAGTVGATETAWIELKVNGVTKYIRLYDSK